MAATELSHSISKKNDSQRLRLQTKHVDAVSKHPPPFQIINLLLCYGFLNKSTDSVGFLLVFLPLVLLAGFEWLYLKCDLPRLLSAVLIDFKSSLTASNGPKCVCACRGVYVCVCVCWAYNNYNHSWLHAASLFTLF